jgi:hypothetical protein
VAPGRRERAQSLTRGARVLVTGVLRQRDWDTPEGEKRYADALLRWQHTPWGNSVLLPAHDEILAMVPATDAPAATEALLACMRSTLRGVPILAEADEPSHAWMDAA